MRFLVLQWAIVLPSSSPLLFLPHGEKGESGRPDSAEGKGAPVGALM